MLGADGEQVHRWESIIQSEENVLKTVNERRQVLIYLFIYFLPHPHDVCVDLVLHRRSRSDPTKLDSELSPPSWPSCAPTLLTARSKGESWRSTASETSTWSLR